MNALSRRLPTSQAADRPEALANATLELIGGLMLIAGFKARGAALAIAAFLVPTTLIFHSPVGPDAQAQMTQFLKNHSILGGMLYVAAFGAGAWGVDRR